MAAVLMKTSRSRGAAGFAVALCLSFAAMGPALGADATKAVTHTVAIEAVRFEPDMLTVKAGDTVVWVNKDPFPHTVTSRAGGFDSHEIAAGQSWRYTSRKAGVFPYVCTLHPTMKGTIKVE